MQSDSEDETGCEIEQEKSRSCQNSNEESQNKNKMAEIAKVFETFLNKKEEVTKKLPNAHNPGAPGAGQGGHFRLLT